jgi:hypothetical protein
LEEGLRRRCAYGRHHHQVLVLGASEDGVDDDRRKGGTVGAVERAEQLRAVALDRTDHVRHEYSSGRQSLAHELEERARGQLERRAVLEEGVECDYVAAGWVDSRVTLTRLLLARRESDPDL